MIKRVVLSPYGSQETKRVRSAWLLPPFDGRRVQSLSEKDLTQKFQDDACTDV